MDTCKKCKKRAVDKTIGSNKCGKCKARSGEHHNKFRRSALEKYGKNCMNPRCPVPPSQLYEDDLDVHHKREVSEFPDDATVQVINSVENAEVYCKICHARKHRNAC